MVVAASASGGEEKIINYEGGGGGGGGRLWEEVEVLGIRGILMLPASWGSLISRLL